MVHSDVFSAFLITTVSLTVVATVLSRIGLPTIVGFILTGLFIGPSGMNWISSIPATTLIAEVGIVFLMFSLGLEFSIDHLKKMMKPLLTLGFTQVASTIAISTAVLHLGLGLPLAKAYLFGACLALSSTAVILKLLQEQRETETPHGRVSIFVLLFQDIAALPLMISLPLLAASPIDHATSKPLFETLATILVFLIGCFVAGFYIVPRLFLEVAKTQSREMFFLLILSVTFLIAALAEQVGLSMSLGAFIAGVLISESPYNKQALAELSPLRDLFLGFFFASVGMMVDLQFVSANLSHLVWLAPALFLVKFSILYAIVRWNSHSHGVSFASALALTQIGEFSFILSASALNLKLIDQQEFQYFLALAVASLLCSPILFSLALKSSGHPGWPELARSLARSFGRKSQNEDLGASEIEQIFSQSSLAPRNAIVIGLGHSGQTTLHELQRLGIPATGLDFNMKMVQSAQSAGLSVLYGDATRPEVLEAAGIREAFLAVISVSGKHLTTQILAMIKRIAPEATTIVRVHYLAEVPELRAGKNDQVIVAEEEIADALLESVRRHYDLISDGPIFHQKR